MRIRRIFTFRLRIAGLATAICVASTVYNSHQVLKLDMKTNTSHDFSTAIDHFDDNSTDTDEKVEVKDNRNTTEKPSTLYYFNDDGVVKDAVKKSSSARNYTDDDGTDKDVEVEGDEEDATNSSTVSEGYWIDDAVATDKKDEDSEDDEYWKDDEVSVVPTDKKFENSNPALYYIVENEKEEEEEEIRRREEEFKKKMKDHPIPVINPDFLKRMHSSNRSEQIRIENGNAFKSNKKVFSHFLVHIPKPGGQYVINRLVKLSNFTYFENGLSNRLQRPCNENKRELKDFHLRFHEYNRGVKCNMWVSEQPIHPFNKQNPIPDHNHYYRHNQTTQNESPPPPYNHAYAIIRKPSDHVLSQYFHCKGSKDHSYAAHLMPPLDEWLDHHVQRYDNATRDNITMPIRDDEYRQLNQHDFTCYDPIDSQSYFTQFDESTTEDDLKQMLDVVGDMSRMEKSICAISIRYTGYVPPMCDCTNVDYDDDRRRLQHDHGVEHHGATFEVTEEQKAKIEKITRLDTLLYERAQRVFQQQVEEIEKELHITLCENPNIGS